MRKDRQLGHVVEDDEGEEPTLLAEGETVHVVCDDKLNKKHLPEEYAATLRGMMEKA